MSMSIANAAASTVNKTDEVLAQVLTKALEVAEKTGQFVVEQAPDVVQQLILYYTVLYWTFSLLGLFVLAVGIPYSIKLFKKAASRAAEYEYRSAPDFAQFWGGFATAAGSLLLGVPLALTHISDALKITLAPKVWLIEYAANLIH
jgi:hypothetical protein